MSATAELARTGFDHDDEDTGGLPGVLDTVREFGVASLGLVAWEYGVSERKLTAAWTTAVRQGLIREVGTCPETGENMFALTD
jgi:hypothetical protein